MLKLKIWCIIRWGKTHGLLIEGGLTYESIKQSVANANIAFREGVSELFEFLEVYIPSFFDKYKFLHVDMFILY